MNNYIFPFLWMRGEPEEVLRTEMEKIDECGIKAVCLEARPHDDFCGPGWWRDFDIILDEAKKRGMKIWILDDKHFPTGYANGLIETQYPERRKVYINIATADIFGGRRPRTLNISRMVKPAIGFWEIGSFMENVPKRADNKMLSIVAVRLGHLDKCREELIDLTDTFDGTFATFTLPEGNWRVFVTFTTQTDGGDENYINMCDSVSAHTQIEGVYEAHYEQYADEFGKTIAGFFSDEPQFGNLSDHLFDNFDTRLCTKKMPLPWSGEMQEMMEEKYGEDLLRLLPLLFMESEEQDMGIQIKYDYMDCVSRLYQKCFSSAIGKWCEEHGVEYIGHVVEDNHIHSRLGMGAGHFFRAISGQHMAGIDSIGDQIVFGAPYQQRKAMIDGHGEFYHFLLGKMGASAGHLDPKKKGRTLCELFGAYGWNFGVRDMKYLLNHLLVKGINHLVPHAFSMADYPDADCPPHFYARGNNPQFPYFAKLMKYGNRMCDLLNGGTHVSSVALLYDGEADWAGEHVFARKTARRLIESQIDFDIVCLDMLKAPEEYNGAFTGNGLTLNGIHFGALVIGGCQQIPVELAEMILSNKMNVYFVDYLPKKLIHGNEDTRQKLLAAENVYTVPLDGLAEELRAGGYYHVTLSAPIKSISFYHYNKKGQIFLFMNEDPNHSYKGTVALSTDETVVSYNGMDDILESVSQQIVDGQTVVEFVLEPGHIIVLMERHAAEECFSGKTITASRKSACEAVCGFGEMDISKDWTVSWTRSIDYPGFDPVNSCVMEELEPLSDRLPTFSGIIRYEKTFTLDQVPAEAYIQAEEVYDVCKVVVNGQNAGVSLIPPYQKSVTGLLEEGENRIVIEVATTPAREQMTFPAPPFDFSYEAMDPAGMYGKITLFIKYPEESSI